MSQEPESPPRRIVVTLDGSALSQKAVPLASIFALALDRPLILLHVLDPEAHKDEAERERAREQWLTYARELAEGRGLAWDEIACVTRTGNAADEILDYVSADDMVVLASHGRGGFRATVTGSVSNKVIRSASCPVVFVPGNCSEPGAAVRQLIVALDGSAAAESALDAAREMAGALDAGIILVGAYKAPPPVSGLDILYYTPEELLPELRAECERYLRDAARPSEQIHAVEGEAAAVLVEAAESTEGSLLVLATRGRGLAKRVVLGSVTETVMRSSSRPLLVVPAKRE